MVDAVRPAAVAGTFYPGEPGALRAVVARLLAAAAPAVAARASSAAKMLLVPHAGYAYSGPVAAHAYALLAPWRERIRRVVLLGPAHRVAVRGLAMPAAEAFDTPLGRIALERDALHALAALPQVLTSDAAHAAEHSLEVQLPFLQSVLDEFTLVPLVVGRASADEVTEVIEQLWGGDETLIVISSDLSHYMPYEQASAIDRTTVERILRLDATLDVHEACGAMPLAGALRAARRHALAARLLDLRNSGDTAGDRTRVVGYCAVAFEPHAAAEAAPGAQRSDADTHDASLGAALVACARNAIAAALGLPSAPEPDHPALAAPGATFVTLRRAGRLRGCVGSLEARRALDADVRAHALAAAFQDRRFKPVHAAEFAALEIEVSLLEPSRPLRVASEAEAVRALQPGVDGVTLEWRDRRATLLPQVWAQLDGPVEFLTALKRKAGLPADFWADQLRLSRYRVRKFAEVAQP